MQDHWRDHVALEIGDAGLEPVVEQALNTIWMTPEGRALIRRSDENISGRVIISDHAGKFGSNANPGVIQLDPQQLSHLQYQSGNQLHDVTVTHVLIHELSHLNHSHPLSFNDLSTALQEDSISPVQKLYRDMGNLMVSQTGEVSGRILALAVGGFADRVLRLPHPYSEVTVQTTMNGIILSPETLQAFNADLAAHPTLRTMLTDPTIYPGDMDPSLLDRPLRPLDRNALLSIASSTGNYTSRGTAQEEQYAVDLTDAFMAKYMPDDASRPARREYDNASMSAQSHGYKLAPLLTRTGQTFELPPGTELPRGIAYGGDLPPGTEVTPAMAPTIDADQVFRDAKAARQNSR